MEQTEQFAFRFLVSCSACGRQYDATGLKAGSRFHCACGETIKVPRPESHDAAVVRCSSCGAPRPRGSENCRHCGAGFTLHERDLHTICPACMTRVADNARFCHHCATPLLPQGHAGSGTEHGCPACGETRKLNGRTLGEPSLSVLECPGCAGLWISAATVEILLERARKTASENELSGSANPIPAIQVDSTTEGPLYRPCPECHELMYRRNFSLKSGVIVDTCRAHGVWFDHQELEQILTWIRRGNESRALNQEREAARQAAFREMLKQTRRDVAERDQPLSAGTLSDLFNGIFGSMFGR